MISLNRDTDYFLRLMKQYFESAGRDLSVPDFASDADFNRMLSLAVNNNCGLFLYHTFRDWCIEYGLEAETAQLFKEQMLLSACLQLRAEEELKEVLEVFNAAGIRYLLLKGVVLSTLYPDPEYRRSSDADIHISDEYFLRAADILTGRGYIYMPNERIKYEHTYKLGTVLTIELHTRFFEEFYEKNYSAIMAIGLEAPSSRRKIRVLDTIVETLSINHLLIYVICHHAKHFISSGIKLRHLLDICVYVNMYNDHLDWNFILSSLEKFNIKDFTLNILYICQHYLGMVDISFLYQSIDEDLIAMLINDIVEKNTEEDNFLKRSSTHDIVNEAYFRNNKEKNTFSMSMASYFPNRKMLFSAYKYAKRHPILLPIAWLHRACSYFWRRIKGQRVLPPNERAKLAEERVELLKRVGIL